MRRLLCISLTVLLVALGASIASAAVIDLFDYGINIDGTLSVPTAGDPVPPAADISSFDTTMGLGKITVTSTGAGAHYVALFVDHEIDEATNTFFNEFGAVTGAPAAGQTWEIDEPGFAFGDIFTNFSNSALDNSNGVPASSPDDVSMALGFDFTLAAGETATLDFLLRTAAPSSGFFLSHTDPDSGTAPRTIYFSASLGITGGPPAVPEPGTFVLLGILLTGVAVVVNQRQRRMD